MLNIPLLQARLAELGYSGAKLAELCGVSREAVSNWLNGDSEPRPAKALALARALELDLRDVLGLAPASSAPLVAYRTRLNRAVSNAAASSALELAEHLRRLQPHLPQRAPLEFARDPAPKTTEAHVSAVAATLRARLGLSDLDILTEAHLLELFRHAEAILVPVLWGLAREKHENALSVHLPETSTSFVVFNLGCKTDDYLYWLAHELGHCLSLHSLQGAAGETYAEQLAQQLLFTPSAAEACATAIGTLRGPRAFDVIESWAKRYRISPVTVLKAVDKHRASQRQATPLESATFWRRYALSRPTVRSVVEEELGSATPPAATLIAFAKQRFHSPVYDALAHLQQAEGGRIPTLIQSTLMLPLADALALSVALWNQSAAP